MPNIMAMGIESFFVSTVTGDNFYGMMRISTGDRTLQEATNKIYVCGNDVVNGSNVTVIDGTTNAIANVTLSASVGAIAVNSVTNRVYVAGQNQVTVISGAK